MSDLDIYNNESPNDFNLNQEEMNQDFNLYSEINDITCYVYEEPIF